MTLNEATCATYSYRIKDYKPPPLTDDFIAAVNRLYQVRSSSSSVKQSEFDKFIDNFGTHFIDSVSWFYVSFSKVQMLFQRIFIVRKFLYDTILFNKAP